MTGKNLPKISFPEENKIEKRYETSNKRDFKGTHGIPATIARPVTSKFYSATETGDTNYEKEYERKYVKKEERGRPGSSSGQRKNNPHPLETFMVWKFPNNRDRSEFLKGKQHQLMQEICNDKIRSTYQVDFLGLKLGEEQPVAPPSNVIESLKDDLSFYTFNKKPKITKNTTARVDYQNRQSSECCKNINKVQHFSSGKKSTPATGIVPTETISALLQSDMYETSYVNDFSNENTDVDPKDVDLSSYLTSLSLSEKHIINTMLNAVSEKDGARKS